MHVVLLQIFIPEDVKHAVAARAGIKSGRIAVVFSDDAERPPTLTRIRSSQRRLVMVGKEWLRKHASKQWARICASRLLGIKEHVLIVDDGDHLEP